MNELEIFERVESKYILTKEQYLQLSLKINDYIKPNQYPHSDTTSLYFDSDNYELIRTSLDHPAYKEKLRIRGYGDITDDSPMFIELKKKYEGVTYKRREISSYQDVREYVLFEKINNNTQIMREVDFLLKSKKLKP